jgi:hypothetical protein
VYGECALLDWQSTGVVYWFGADRWRQRESRMVLAHGVERKRWDWNRDLQLARSEQNCYCQFFNRVMCFPRHGVETRTSYRGANTWEKTDQRRHCVVQLRVLRLGIDLSMVEAGYLQSGLERSAPRSYSTEQL